MVFFFQVLKTSNKFGLLSKLEKRNNGGVKKISYQQIMMLWLFFRFTANLHQSGDQMPDSWSTILSFFIDKLEKEEFLVGVSVRDLSGTKWALLIGKIKPSLELNFYILIFL